MKKLSIQINYNTAWGQILHLVIIEPQLDNWDKINSKSLIYIGNSIWQTDIEVAISRDRISFYFLVKEGDTIIKQEYGEEHNIQLSDGDTTIKCKWQAQPIQKYFYTSLFQNSVFKQNYNKLGRTDTDRVQLIVDCVHISQQQELVISGSSSYLGQWEENKTHALIPISYGKWGINIPKLELENNTNYKFAIRNKSTNKIVEWEEGENRTIQSSDLHQIEELTYHKSWIDWKASGVTIPIFSLRSEKSFGIGEFSDLKLLIDWAKNSKMNIVQVLPINDTTATYSWVDSYPYNAISIYALNPIYLGLQNYPLKDGKQNKRYLDEARQLNKLSTIDYTKVIQLKAKYINDLYLEIGNKTLAEKEFKFFFDKNKEWLFPYACFCHLRDRFNTTKLSDWEEFSSYNENELRAYLLKEKGASESINRTYFTQYLLHLQLTEAKEFAHTKGVVLKGDIPIGISPNSVEAWTEPHLFNMNTQTGAPPDDFSVNGQNWGFPTYNWAEMRKDNYSWWTKRFTKMADYFDAYRIDHILGFFRIWEIPDSSVYGLLGYFSPVLPLRIEEIENYGLTFDEQMTIATIYNEDLVEIFGERSKSIIANYLDHIDEFRFILKEKYNTQRKIEKEFRNRNTEEDKIIREALYQLCNEVLFIQDKNTPNKYHPRIALHNTLRYKRLSSEEQNILAKIYEEFFYQRHSQFWREEAMSKLPTLINSTNMLVCGEDLGMVPESVPSVMAELEILSLEIQRMPKKLGVNFSDLNHLPYMSVATTSTHDMPPLRKWWTEDAKRTQNFYTHSLNLKGEAPKDCNTAISLQIIKEHLNSPAMLTILPLQDWLSISDKLKRENADEEQINMPAISQHNWNYRMHLTLEELANETEFSDLIYFLNKESGR